MLVLEDGKFITLQDQAGNRIGFSSPSDFEKYTGASLGSYWNINYEPDSNIFTINKEHKPLAQMDSTLYNSLIDNIPTWKSNQADKFYGMTPGDRVSAEAAYNTEQERLSDISAAQVTAGIKKLTVTQGENWIDSRLDRATNLAELRTELKIVLKRMLPYLL